jgi:hypothetical protein
LPPASRQSRSRRHGAHIPQATKPIRASRSLATPEQIDEGAATGVKKGGAVKPPALAAHE